MTLPPTLIEADALAFARQRIAHYRDMGGFRPAGGHDLHRNALKQFAKVSAFNLSTVKHYARSGSIDAHEALRAMTAEELAHDGRVRPQLADYVIDQFNPALMSRPRGRQKATNFLRDCLFVGVVGEVVYRFNLSPMRNRAARQPRRPSACAIVAEAIRLELPAGASNIGARGLERIGNDCRRGISSRPRFTKTVFLPKRLTSLGNNRTQEIRRYSGDDKPEKMVRLGDRPTRSGHQLERRRPRPVGGLLHFGRCVMHRQKDDGPRGLDPQGHQDNPA